MVQSRGVLFQVVKYILLYAFIFLVAHLLNFFNTADVVDNGEPHPFYLPRSTAVEVAHIHFHRNGGRRSGDDAAMLHVRVAGTDGADFYRSACEYGKVVDHTKRQNPKRGIGRAAFGLGNADMRDYDDTGDGDSCVKYTRPPLMRVVRYHSRRSRLICWPSSDAVTTILFFSMSAAVTVTQCQP